MKKFLRINVLSAPKSLIRPARWRTRISKAARKWIEAENKDLAAFRVDRAFETLDLRPFTVSRHTAELCFLDLKVA